MNKYIPIADPIQPAALPGCQLQVTTGEPAKLPWTSVVGFLVQPTNQLNIDASYTQKEEKINWRGWISL